MANQVFICVRGGGGGGGEEMGGWGRSPALGT